MADKNQRIYLSEEQLDGICYLKELVQKLEKTTEDIRNLLTTIMIVRTDKPKKKSNSMKNDDKKKKLEVDELSANCVIWHL